MSFISDLRLIDHGASDIVAKDLLVMLGEYNFYVPCGFITDYASTPRILTPLIPHNGDYDRASVIHDYLYWLQDSTSDDLAKIACNNKKPQEYMLKKNGCIISVDKKTADSIFKMALQFLGVGTFKSNAMYYSVKFFGGGAFSENKKNKQLKGFQYKFKIGINDE